MKLIHVIFLIFIFLITFTTLYSRDGNWETAYEKEGIKLYERRDPSSGLMEFMSVTVIDARMEVIGEVLRDVDNFSRWMSDCSHASIVKSISRNEMVIHMVLNPPFIEDRELILRNRTEYDFDSGSALISFAADYSGGFSPAKGKVKVPVMEGYYRMDYLGRDRTRFCYRLKSDPGGTIPKIAAYSSMKFYPYNTARGLKKMLMDPKYSRSASGSTEEKEIESRMKDRSIIKKILFNRLSPFVENREVLSEIIKTDSEAVENIIKGNGMYTVVEKATNGYFEKYLDRTVSERGLAMRIKADADFTKAFIDMINSDCGAGRTTLEKMIAVYRR